MLNSEHQPPPMSSRVALMTGSLTIQENFVSLKLSIQRRDRRSRCHPRCDLYCLYLPQILLAKPSAVISQLLRSLFTRRTSTAQSSSLK